MTARDYLFIGFFEDTDGAGVEGVTGITIEAQKVLKTDVTDNTDFLDGESVTEELGGGFYGYQGEDIDLILYDFPFKMITADAGVAFKNIAGMLTNPADAEISDVILTNASSAAASMMDGANLTLTNKLTFLETISDLTIPANWEKAILTVKDNDALADAQSILQILVTSGGHAGDGIQYVNRAEATATEKGYGSLTVNQGAGTVVVSVQDDMVFSAVAPYGFDIKFLIAGSTSTKPAKSAIFKIQNTETKAIEVV